MPVNEGLVTVLRSPYVREMGGKGRHRVLATQSSDPVLSLVGALGLGASVGTALVVDLGPGSRNGSRSLADIVTDGPSLDELSPGRRGLAFITGGGVPSPEAVEIVERLARRWPAVVVRVDTDEYPIPTARVEPLVAGRLVPKPAASHAVWQPVGTSIDPPGPGPVLPRLRAGLAAHLLDGRVPRRSRWIAALRPVWEMPWE